MENERNLTNKTNEPNEYRSFWAYLALAEFFYALFYFSMPINNNFNSIQFFTFYIFLPTLVLLIGVIIALKFIELSMVRFINGVALIVFLVIFGVISVQTESIYADHLMYIAGYEIIYYDEIFAILLALVFSMCYLELKNVLAKSKSESDGELILCVLKHLAISLLISGILLWIADSLGIGISIYLGLSFLLVSNAYGYFMKNKIRLKEQTIAMNPEKHAADPALEQKIKSPLILSLLLPLFALLLGFLSAYLFSVDFVGYGKFGGEEGFWLARFNERWVLQEFIQAFVILGAIGIIFINNPSVANQFKEIKDPAKVLGISIFALGLAWWGMLNLGGTFLFIRSSTYLAPLLMILVLLWLTSAALQNRSTIGRNLGIASVLLSLGSWAGMIMIGESIDGFDYIVPGVLILFIVFIFVSNKFIKKSQRAASNQQNGAPIKKVFGTNFMQTLAKVSESRGFGVALLIGIILVPSLLFISIPTFGSSNQFKLLAKVDNSAIFYLANPYTRIDKNYQPVFSLSEYQNPDPTIDLYSARNEYETSQIVMKPINQKHFSIYSAEFSDFVHLNNSSSIIGKGNMSIFRVREVEALSGIVMDILEPFASFAIADGTNAPLWLRIYTPTNAQAGIYKGSLHLTVDNKEQDWSLNPKSLAINITLHVYNFTLPQEPSLKSNFGFYTTRPEFLQMMQLFQRNRMMHWSFIRAPTFTIANNGSILEMNYTDTDADIALAHSYGTRTLGIHADFYKHIISNSTFEIDGTEYSPSTYWISNISRATLADYFKKIKQYYLNITYIDEHGKNRSFFEEIYLNGYDEIDGGGGDYKLMALGDYEMFIAANCTLPIMQTSTE